MKNYYEILEVDKNASPETIEKVYRTLAKKYHPDLYEGEKKEEYTEKIKEIIKAYNVLSNEETRAEYDESLKNNILSQEEQERISQENYELKQQITKMEQQQALKEQIQMYKKENVDQGSIMNMGRVLKEQLSAAKQKAYHDAYISDLKNRGYKIKYKHGLKDYLRAVLFVIAIIVISFLVYQIPPVKQFFQNLYNENIVFKTLVDIFTNTF